MRGLKSLLPVSLGFVIFLTSAGTWAAAQPADFAAIDNAFQAQASFSLNAGESGGCFTLATVPAKTRLVVEYVSATVGPPPAGQSVRDVQLRTQLGTSPPVYHNLVQNMTNSGAELMVGQLVRIYADPVASVDICVGRQGGTTGTLTGFASVSGHYAPH